MWISKGKYAAWLSLSIIVLACDNFAWSSPRSVRSCAMWQKKTEQPTHSRMPLENAGAVCQSEGTNDGLSGVVQERRGTNVHVFDAPPTTRKDAAHQRTVEDRQVWTLFCFWSRSRSGGMRKKVVEVQCRPECCFPEGRVKLEWSA